MEWMLAAFIRPFVLFALAIVILYPARRAVEIWMTEGWVKRLLLSRRPIVMIPAVVIGYGLIVLVALLVSEVG